MTSNFWRSVWTSVKIKSKNYSYFTDFFAKIYSLLTHVHKTPPLRSHYRFWCPTRKSNFELELHSTDCLPDAHLRKKRREHAYMPEKKNARTYLLAPHSWDQTSKNPPKKRFKKIVKLTGHTYSRNSLTKFGYDTPEMIGNGRDVNVSKIMEKLVKPRQVNLYLMGLAI